MSLVILVPVLERPHRVVPLLQSIADSTPEPYRVLFITDPGDEAEREAVREAGAEELAVGGSYARKINVGVARTTEPLLFFGADDIAPQPGWFEAARRYIDEGAHVVGVNDLIRRRHRVHATHFLVTRAYAERPTIDGAQGPLSIAYFHQFVDDELIATAEKRGVYAYAQDSHVRHDHPTVHRADDDETYRKGRRTFARDRRRFEQRRALWG